MASKNDTAPVVPPHTSSEAAFEQIHKANRNMRYAVVITLAIMTILLGFGIMRLNQVYENEQRLLTLKQDEINRRAVDNRKLLEALTTTGRDTQVLICNVINIQSPDEIRPPEVAAQIEKICGPILRDPDNNTDTNDEADNDRPTSFLPQASGNAGTLSVSQPTTGSAPPPLNENTNGGSSTPPSGPSQPTQTPTPAQPGLVETASPMLSDTLCTAQQLITNGCIIR